MDVLSILLKAIGVVAVFFVGWWLVLGLLVVTEGRYIGPVFSWLTKRTRSGAWDVILHLAFVGSAATLVYVICWSWLDAAPGIPWREAVSVGFAAGACLEADYWLRRRKKPKQKGGGGPAREQNR